MEGYSQQHSSRKVKHLSYDPTYKTSETIQGSQVNSVIHTLFVLFAQVHLFHSKTILNLSIMRQLRRTPALDMRVISHVQQFCINL